MIHQDTFFSPNATFSVFIIPVWPWISLEREISKIWILRTRSSQCHSNPVLFPLIKPPNHVMYLYDGHTYDPRTEVYIWMRMDMVPVEYGKFPQMFHLMMWFFQFNTRIYFWWEYVIWCIFDLLVCISLCTKLRIYRVPLEPLKWSCQGFRYIRKSFIMMWMLMSKRYTRIYHRRK